VLGQARPQLLRTSAPIVRGDVGRPLNFSRQIAAIAFPAAGYAMQRTIVAKLLGEPMAQFIGDALIRRVGYVLVKYGQPRGRRGPEPDDPVAIAAGLIFLLAFLVLAAWVLRHLFR